MAKESRWLKALNGRLLVYLNRRRIIEGFQGDLNLAERRAEVINLADWFVGLEAEHDPGATMTAIHAGFDHAMDRIQDS